MKTHTHTYTPGPWSVETKGSRHFIDGADELTVAYVDRAGVRERQTYEANARLIAAAPELLAALHDLLGHAAWVCPSVRDGMRVELGAAIKHAEKAIAKAEGRA